MELTITVNERKMNFDKPTRDDKITYLISLRGNITQEFDDYLKTEYNKMDNDELDIEYDFTTNLMKGKYNDLL